MSEYYGEGVFNNETDEKLMIDVAEKYLIKSPRNYHFGLAQRINDIKRNFKGESPTNSEMSEFAIGSSPEDLYVMVNEALKAEASSIWNELEDSILGGVVESGHYDINDEYQPEVLNTYERIKNDFELIYNVNGLKGIGQLVDHLIGTFRDAQKPFLLYSQPDKNIKKINVTPEYVKKASSILFMVYSILKDLGLDPKDFNFTTIRTDKNDVKQTHDFNLDDMVKDFGTRYGFNEVIDPSNYNPQYDVRGKVTIPTTKIMNAVKDVLSKEISNEPISEFNKENKNVLQG